MSILNNTTLLNSLLEKANSLPKANNGVELPALTNEGTSADLLWGKQLIDQEGNIVAGTIETRTEQDLSQMRNAITGPAGYYPIGFTGTVEIVDLSTPAISVSSSGLITASINQDEGYIRSGSKNSTKQLTTKSATTYTPKTSNQTIASGTYLTGTQTIKGDSNLVAGNIVEGKSIFGVTGTSEPASALSEELTAQDTLISQLMSSLQNKTSAGSGSNLETCTVTVIDDAIIEIIYQGASNGKIITKRANVVDGTTITDALVGGVIIVERYHGDGLIGGNDLDICQNGLSMSNNKYVDICFLRGSTNLYTTNTSLGDNPFGEDE